MTTPQIDLARIADVAAEYRREHGTYGRRLVIAISHEMLQHMLTGDDMPTDEYGMRLPVDDGPSCTDRLCPCRSSDPVRALQEFEDATGVRLIAPDLMFGVTPPLIANERHPQ